MILDQLPHTDAAAASADPSALQEYPLGVDQPGWSPNFVATFSSANNGRFLPDLAGMSGIIRRPTGLPSSQVGQGVDTPRGSNTPLSAGCLAVVVEE